MRRALIGAVLTLLLGVGVVAAGAVATNNGQTRAVVLFVGDSNVTVGAGEIEWALTLKDNQYVPVLASRMGGRIRTPDCRVVKDCKTFNYWKFKLDSFRSKVNADVIVNNLGINDTMERGTATGPGYSFYGRKIDWFMGLARGKPVLWTTLPCSLEPRNRQTGCNSADYELYRARDRWPNLTVLAWGSKALGHPEYMEQPGRGVHYSDAGHTAWAEFVAGALDARFPAP
jgi:hypothetical protein